jgi:hypothetical protein
MKAKLFCTAVLALASFAAAAQDPTARCMEGLSGEPRLSPIADKVALVRSSQAFVQRVADRLPTGEERAAVAVWMNLRNQCYQAGDAYRRRIATPQEVAYTRSVFVFQQLLAADLQSGRVTYAEYNRRRLELVQSAGEEI